MDLLQTIIRLSETKLSYAEEKGLTCDKCVQGVDPIYIDSVFQYLPYLHAVVFAKLFLKSITVGKISKKTLEDIFPNLDDQGLSTVVQIASQLSDVLPLILQITSNGCEIFFETDFRQSLLRNNQYDLSLDGKTWPQIIQIASKLAEKHFFGKISSTFYKKFLSQNFGLVELLEFSYKWQFLPFWERQIVLKLAIDQQRAQLGEPNGYVDISSTTLIELGMTKYDEYTKHFNEIVEIKYDRQGNIAGYELNNLKTLTQNIHEDNLQPALCVVRTDLIAEDVCFKKIGIYSSNETFNGLLAYLSNKKYDHRLFRLADILLYEGKEQIERAEKIIDEIKQYIDELNQGGRKFIFLDYEMVKSIADDSSRLLLKELINNILNYKSINVSVLIRTDDLNEFEFSTILELDESQWNQDRVYEKRHSTRLEFLKKKR